MNVNDKKHQNDPAAEHNQPRSLGTCNESYNKGNTYHAEGSEPRPEECDPACLSEGLVDLVSSAEEDNNREDDATSLDRDPTATPCKLTLK